MILRLHLLGYIGRKTLGFLSEKIEISAFFYNILKALLIKNILKDKAFKKRMMKQVYFSGIKSFPAIILIAFAAGSISILQFTSASEVYSLGRTAFLIIFSELAPLSAALIIIMRSSAFLTVGINYSKKSKGLSFDEFVEKICLPTGLGVIFSSICLMAVFNITALVGGYISVRLVTYITVYEFITETGSVLLFKDIIIAFLKAFCFGIIIATNCLFYGVKNDMKKVFNNTASASVQSFIFCVLTSIAISFITFSYF